MKTLTCCCCAFLRRFDSYLTFSNEFMLPWTVLNLDASRSTVKRCATVIRQARTVKRSVPRQSRTTLRGGSGPFYEPTWQRDATTKENIFLSIANKRHTHKLNDAWWALENFPSMGWWMISEELLSGSELQKKNAIQTCASYLKKYFCCTYLGVQPNVASLWKQIREELCWSNNRRAAKNVMKRDNNMLIPSRTGPEVKSDPGDRTRRRRPSILDSI